MNPNEANLPTHNAIKKCNEKKTLSLTTQSLLYSSAKMKQFDSSTDHPTIKVDFEVEIILQSFYNQSCILCWVLMIYCVFVTEDCG